jgi:hypothetical protein
VASMTTLEVRARASRCFCAREQQRCEQLISCLRLWCSSISRACGCNWHALCLYLLCVALCCCLQTAADQIAANYHSVVAGTGPLPANLVDRQRGY